MHRNSYIRTICYSLMFVCYSSLLFAQDYGRKKIGDKNFRYEFYTSDAVPAFRSGVMYYWFKGGAIHQSESSFSGQVLDGKFEKFFLNTQLAEQGLFKLGLKHGLWYSWHQNGKLAEEATWRSGIKRGEYKSFDENGFLIESGKYRKGKKHGRWINWIKKDTIVYNRGVIIPKKIKQPKKEKSKVPLSEEELKKPKQTAGKTKKKSEEKRIEKTKQTHDNSKQGFFKRLFSKKKKNTSNSGK